MMIFVFLSNFRYLGSSIHDRTDIATYPFFTFKTSLSIQSKIHNFHWLYYLIFYSFIAYNYQSYFSIPITKLINYLKLNFLCSISSNLWTVVRVPWQQYLQGLDGPHGQVMDQWISRNQVTMVTRHLILLTIHVMAGPEIWDSHLHLQSDKGQGMSKMNLVDSKTLKHFSLFYFCFPK